MSRAYLAEWVRQLCASDTTAPDVDKLTTDELTQLVLLFADRSVSTDAQA